MRGVKSQSRRLGYGEAPMPEADPKVKEGRCPLCGNYGPLSRMGWCYDRGCKDAARDMLRQEAAANGGIVPGEYYRVGNTELINLVVFESYTDDPAPLRDPNADLCTASNCTEFALPRDGLCHQHKLEDNRRKYHAARNQRHGSPRKRKGRNRKISNKIRGLENLKLNK